MRRHSGLIIFVAIVAALALSAVGAISSAAAQNAQGQAGSELEIPLPQSQVSPPQSQLPRPKNSQPQSMTIPQVEQQPRSVPRLPRTPAQSTLEIPLPKVFRGCWRGVVPRLDSLRRLGGPGISKWIPKTFRICYVQTAGGPFQPTFSRMGIEGYHQSITNVRGILKVISTDGRTTARMRSLLHFDEPSGAMFGLFPGTGSVDELTNMTCRIEGGVMRVEAHVYAQWDGRPWSLMTWHAEFESVPE